MTPKELGYKMVEGMSVGTPGDQGSTIFPFALITLSLSGTRVDVVIPHIYHKMIQDPENRAKLVLAFKDELEIMGKHPEDWNGRVDIR